MSGRSVSVRPAVLGALAGVVLTVSFVSFVGPVLATVVGPLPELVAYGLMLLFVGAFRATAGMWTAMRVRARHEVDERVDFLPTAIAAALGGWLLYAALTVGLELRGAGGGSGVPLWRLLLEAPRWCAEYAVGALLVSPAPADPVGRTRVRLARRSEGSGTGRPW